MGEFVVSGVRYRSRSTTAREEWQFYTLCQPVLGAFTLADAGITGRMGQANPLQALKGLDDQASSALFACARSMCERQTLDGWVPADQPLSLVDLVSLVVGAAGAIFSDFLAFKPTVFRPHSRDGAAYEHVTMADGKAWLFRPMLRGFCKGESYYDGTLHLAQVAELNDVIDVADENEYRARVAAERAAAAAARNH